MLKEGLHDEDAYDIISCLQSKHFYKGPESDDDGSPGNVMVFIYPYAGKRLYIKLKIWSEVNGYAGAVMSFHEEGKHA